MAEAAEREMELDGVLFIPARVSPFKVGEPAGAGAEERWAMLLLATLDHPSWRVVRWDLEAEPPSYSLRTVQTARARLGAGCELFWILGADNLAALPRWRQVEQLAREVAFLAVPRAELHGESHREAIAALPPFLASRVRALAMPPVDVQATVIRATLAAGKPPGEQLPELVTTFIERYNPYG